MLKVGRQYIHTTCFLPDQTLLPTSVTAKITMARFIQRETDRLLKACGRVRVSTPGLQLLVKFE